MSKKFLKLRLLIVPLTIFVFIGTVFSVLRFNNKLRADEYALQKESLLDMAKLEASVLEVKLGDYINTLYVIAEFIRQDELYTPQHMEHLHQVVDNSQFHQLGIITLDGILHDTQGDVDVSDRDYYQGILRKEAFVTGIINSRFTGEEVIAMAVPVYSDSGQLLGAAHGTVLVDEFQPYTDTSLAVGNANTYVFDRSGKYIIKNNTKGESWSHDNIFDHLEQAENGMAIENLRAAIQGGLSVTTEVVSGDRVYLCCFLPLRNSEWYALVDIPKAKIHAYVSQVLDRDFYGMLISVVSLVGFLCIVILIWNHRRSTWEQKREIELRERLMAKVVGFMVVDLDEQRILSRSGQGFLQNDLSLKSYSEYITNVVETCGHPEYQKPLFEFFSAENIREAAEKGFQDRTMEFLFCYMEDRKNMWLECESLVDLDKETGHLIVSHVLRDIDSRKRAELALRSEAERDMLTGLYNRSTGTKMIDRHLSTSSHKDQHAWILLDLDNFKTLNDTLGHQLGDQALKDVANILTSHVRKDDIVCRLGGDEFVVFMKNISSSLAREKLKTLLKKLRLKYEADNQSVWISASAGVVFASSGDNFEKLYHHADQALYQAKRDSKGTFREYQ